ncbi:tryptophan synthase subunit alpha [Salinicola rhizosphaerae]|uniref:Tryptophan synthase alpha chain n=1 Tax=Salinicola rhizosphaerae TaxID=1443141 RepID=A0ABQ3DRX9_9GAMM|nr:tryptophan synthase subunit alpha [Salinicola rhizosphaerae]GHB13653.1 tryptophan synthase alpha chain [Salinicola rhizosphaerae]
MIPTVSDTEIQTDSRLARCFERCRAQQRGALVTYVMAGDPDLDTSRALLEQLPAAGADIIELGMPFSDPMADGVAIQRAGQRALKGGQTLARTLDLVRDFRRQDDRTPLVLMGYLNPLVRYGERRFLEAAAEAGIDGLILVDLPYEHGATLTAQARDLGLARIPLVAPTTPGERLPALLAQGDGFVYRIAFNGVTGSRALDLDHADALERQVIALRRHRALPVAIGFGVRDAGSASGAARIADAVVVGSALVERLADEGVDAALALTRELAKAVREARS